MLGAQLGKLIKIIGHLKQANFMPFKLYFDKVIKKKKKT